MNKKIGLLVGILIVVASVSAFFLTRTREATSPESEEKRQQLLAVSDIDSLKDPNSPPRDQALALLRLATQDHLLAKEKALEWSNSSNVQLRQAAAESLAIIFDEKSKEALATLLKTEKDPTLLSRIAKGVAYRNSEERLQWLKEHSKLDQLEVQSGIIKLSSDPAEKNKALGELMKLARETKDSRLSTRAYSRVMSLAPHNKEVIQLIRERVYSSKDEQEKAMSLRHLALIKDPKALEVFEKFSKDPSAVLRKTALQVIPSLCPETRWNVLNALIHSERDRSVVGLVIEMPKILREENTNSIYTEWLALEDLSESEKIKIRENIQFLKTSDLNVGPCTAKEVSSPSTTPNSL